MNVLFRVKSEIAREALGEMVADMNGRAFFAHDAEDAIRYMNHDRIDLFFLEIRSMADVAVLKYANDNFGSTRIVLIAEDILENAVSALKNGKFLMMKNSLNLNDFKDMITVLKEGPV